MQQNGKRIVWVDNLKFFSIVLVMIFHTTFGASKLAPQLVIDFFAPFFLPAFFFASGFVYNASKFRKNGFASFVKNKAFVLLMPWLLWGIIRYGYYDIVCAKFNLALFINDVLRNFIQVRDTIGQMWFVFALFVAFVPFYFIIDFVESKEISHKGIILVLMSIVLAFCYYIYYMCVPSSIFPWNNNYLPWHLDYIPFALCFMILGYASHYYNILNLENNLYGIVIFVIYTLLVYFVKPSSTVFIMLSSVLKHYLGVYVIAWLSNKLPYMRWPSFIGQNTLVYFGFHPIALSLLNFVLLRIVSPEWVYSSNIRQLLVSTGHIFVLTLIHIPLIYIINRYFRFLAGKK